MNKEQLENMSDFELSELISVKLGLNVSKEQWMHLGDRDENLVIIDTSDDSSDIINRTFDTVDYCNNPSDMMPLVFERGISLWAHPCEPDIYHSKGYLSPIDVNNLTYAYSKHKNGLRAAAIVFLLMQE